MNGHNIYTFCFCEMRKLYIAKVEKKGKTADEVDEIICWLTGYTKNDIQKLENNLDMENFFSSAPMLNPNRNQIKGSICGVKIDEIKEPIMKEIRYLDKLIDELAKGKDMKKILRS